jgi:hypothetical protein
MQGVEQTKVKNTHIQGERRVNGGDEGEGI